MTIREAKIYIRTELKAIYPENEINAFIRILFEDLLGISGVVSASEHLRELSEEQTNEFVSAVERLKQEEPIQHIVGFTFFYGFKIAVNRAVLIPRPETEELVDMVIKEHAASEALKVLDIGTGSGCIAIALAGHLKNATVYALDIEDQALQVAKSNALENTVQVHFIQGNMFSDISELKPGTFDGIVSNPPYVCESEKAVMSKNVVGFDPPSALYVEDHNPLIFYKRIADYASRLLKPSGSLYVEINERFGKEVSELFEQSGFVDVMIYKDIHGKERFVSGKKQNNH
jgi:release factor glutamine methyltransferase